MLRNLVCKSLCGVLQVAESEAGLARRLVARKTEPLVSLIERE